MERGMELEILACPECRGELQSEREALTCLRCQRQYAVQGGVPIFHEAVRLPEQSEETQGLSVVARGAVGRGRVYRALARALRHPLRHSAQAEDLVRGLGDGLARDARILNLGSGEIGLLPGSLAPWQDRVVNVDVTPGPAVDIVADGHKLPFHPDSFDLVLMICVLEHVRDAETVVREVRRVLKPGGCVYSSTPFLSRFHGESDYRRWTLMGLRYLFREFTSLECRVDCGPASALALALREFVPLFSDSRYFQLTTKYVSSFLLLPLSWLDFYLCRKRDAHKLAQSFCLVARKAGKANS